MSFGWSAGDIFTLVATCYKIVENCREGLTSASIQIKGLRNDLEEFYTVLVHLHEVVKDGKNIAFFDLKDMKATMKSCDAYLDKYKHLQLSKGVGSNNSGPNVATSSTNSSEGLKRRSSFSKSKELLDKSKETGLKLSQAVIWTTLGGESEIQELQRKLARHRQTLVLYLQILERNRRIKEDSNVNKRLSNVEAMVKDLHSNRRLSNTGSPDTLPRSPRMHYQRQNDTDYEDYEAIFRALNEQKRLALMETERADNDDTLQEWNDILDHLEIISRRVLNAAERTASSTAQRRTGSASYQIKLNRMLTPHHTIGTPPSLRPIQRTDTHDSGFAEMLPQALAPLPEESSGLSEAFAQSAHVVKPVQPQSSFLPDGMVEHYKPMTPNTLLKQRTLSVSSLSRPVLSPSSSAESVGASTAPFSRSPRQSRTFSMSSSEVSFSAGVSHWQTIQFDGWVKCTTTTSGRPISCTVNGGYDSNGKLYALQIRKQDSSSSSFIIKLSTHKKRPLPQVEPFGERDIPEEGYQAYFISPLDTEPKGVEVQFFFQNEKSLNDFESLVYGQELLLTVNIKKISSSGKNLSEGQRLRVWKKNDTKSLLFYTTKCEKSKGRYHSIPAREVLQSKVVGKSSLDLKLQNNSHHLQDLKIEFLNKTGWSAYNPYFSSF
ncbi:hypothetical protein TSTA_123760 [Talaromyces stipitatus ATCC 10500]|uniref:Uncharacterized protein n=1 Tax=Talaromyces stipitatus (strain ATCC 10500 / CBS 375.48 / QM 6759 / NRRL 1006) TaxID=441959 RepID=B8MAE5_TALSN|nr:uncharacterized protein TSTA_123760 [Talaromyces stipitatus ATCC 10500]EED18647.1 hypothetical protein TSTA_123760 [Talaromyces stipitatus ATCC 10500]